MSESVVTVGQRSAFTVFDLLGRHENDLTYAIGWCLNESHDFLAGFLRAVGVSADPAGVGIWLQTYDRSDTRAGITDIQLRSPDLHVIVEAKRDWTIPTRDQLKRYAPVLARAKAPERRFVVLTRWGADARAVVAATLGDEVAGFPISTLGVSDVLQVARAAARIEGKARPRLFLGELLAYLDGGGYVGSYHDSRVYVVPLGDGMSEIGIAFREIPYKLGVYWYGLRGAPKVPPNYVAFRFDGRLQSIHHVEGSQVFGLISEVHPETTTDWGPGIEFTLGPAIRPEGVGSGRIRNTRVWADIDLLFTSNTVEEAARLTRERDERANAE